MNARKCDRCGEFYEPYSVWNGGSGSAFRQKKPSGIMFVLTDESNAQWCQAEYKGIPETGKKTRGLCPKCMDELLAWWADGKDGAEHAAD